MLNTLAFANSLTTVACAWLYNQFARCRRDGSVECQ